MCEALKELMKEELDEALARGTELGREALILGALKNSSSAEEIARVLGISLKEVLAVAKKIQNSN